MPASAKDRRRFSGHQASEQSLPVCLATSAMAGAAIGVLDFCLFEINGSRSMVTEFVFSKPGFWSLSILALQTIVFAVFSVLLCVGAFLAKKLVLRRFDFLDRLSPSHFTAFSLCSLVFALRILKNSNQVTKIVLLVFLSILMFVLTHYFFKNTFREAEFTENFRAKRRAFLLPLTVASAIFLISFLAPDFYSMISRATLNTDVNEIESPNVLLIVLDTVGMDDLGCYGNTRTDTPNIDRISSEGLLFLNAFSTAPWTVPSHASMFTGLQTFQHRADWGHTYLTQEHLTLAEHLEDRGFRTAGFSENPFVGPNSGLDQGFAQFHESWKRPMVVRAINKLLVSLSLVNHPLEYANRTVGLFRRWLRDGAHDGRPFFAFINFMAPHLPRYPRLEFEESPWSADTLRKIEPVNLIPERFYLEEYALSEDDLSVMREIYHQEIGYIDSFVGEIVDFLEQDGELDNTVLIVTGDHGEGFGEHGFFEHQLCLYNTLIHVPLIIRFPKLVSPKNVEYLVSTASIFNTVIEMSGGDEIETESRHFGLEMPALHLTSEDQIIVAEFANGVDMMRGAIGHEAPNFDFSPYDRELKCLILGIFKYIWDSAGNEQLFDIRSDPAESNDIAAQEENRVLQYRQILAELTRSAEPSVLSEGAPETDDATKDALKALGYLP